jgi:hypothetical protein
MTPERQAPRQIELRLERDGSKLSGVLTARSGAVRGALQLKDVRYANGTLRFVLESGGYPQHFRGHFEGATIAGTIHDNSEKGPATGRFELRFSR